MNETYPPVGASDRPQPTSDHTARGPDTPPLPVSGQAEPSASGLLKNAEQDAHDTIDRFADGAEPAVRQLGESVAAAEKKLQAKADQLRETRDEWVESVRSTVRSKPLASLAAAVALGAVIARITR